MDLSAIDSSDITELIGTNSPHFLIDEDNKSGEVNEPYAVHTKLGRVFMGRKTCVPTKAIINELGTLRTIGEVPLEHRKS